MWIPEAVESELQNIADVALRKIIDEAKRAGWLKLRRATNGKLVSLLLVDLHQGEAEAIALALEMKADRLLIGEREGRLMARQLSLTYRGRRGPIHRNPMFDYHPLL